jgi:hypothetical protein
VTIEDDLGGKILVGIVGKQPGICPYSAGFPSAHIKVAPYVEWINNFIIMSRRPLLFCATANFLLYFSHIW